MTTRWIVFGLHFFAVSAFVAFAVTLLGPMPAMRFCGYVALSCAAAGIALNLYALREADPDAWRAWWHRLASLPERLGMRWRAALHRHDVAEVQR